MFSQRSYRQLAAAVLVLALGVRIVGAIWWEQRLARQNQVFDFPDSESYCHLAKRLAHGESFEFGPDGKIFRTPGYPMLIAPGYWLEGTDPPRWWLRGLGIALGVATVAAAMALARQLFGERAALLAGLFIAFDVGAVSLSVFALSEAPFCPLMLIHLWLWAASWQAEESGLSRNRGLTLAFAGGVVAAIATMMRPSYLLFVPFASVLGCLWFRPITRHVKLAAIMLLGLSAAMSPWWIRNAMISGEFVPTTLQVGASLYDGISPEANGASDMRFVPPFTQKQREQDAAAVEPPVGTFESRLDRSLKNASIAFAKENPRRVVELAGIKFLRIWSPWPNAAELGGGLLRLATALTYLPILMLGIAGLIRFRSMPFAWLCFVPAVYFTSLHVIFVSSLRYRQPAMLAVAVLAGAMLATWLRRRDESTAIVGEKPSR